MDEGFHPDLMELLAEPITHLVMASDKVDMPSLVALLKAARQRLNRPVRKITEPARRTRFNSRHDQRRTAV